MNQDPYDLFREMDALADHLFARMARKGETGFPGKYRYPEVFRDGDICPEPVEKPDTILSCSVSDPNPEVHRIENEVIVVAGLPGATRESVRLAVVSDRLRIDADGGDRQYHTAAAIPPVDSGSMKVSMKNGVLEVKFRIL